MSRCIQGGKESYILTTAALDHIILLLRHCLLVHRKWFHSCNGSLYKKCHYHSNNSFVAVVCISVHELLENILEVSACLDCIMIMIQCHLTAINMVTDFAPNVYHIPYIL